MNVFVPMGASGPAWAALARAGLTADPTAGVARAAFDSIPLHAAAAARTSIVSIADRTVRILSAPDLVVLKALFNRAKDWVDIERLVAVLDTDFDRVYCRHQLVAHVGEGDPAVAQLDRVFATH